MCLCAFSRVEDNVTNMSVPTGYKVKSRKGWGVSTLCPYQSARESGPRPAQCFLVGWVPALLRIRPGLLSDGPRAPVTLCWQPDLGIGLIIEGCSGVVASWHQLELSFPRLEHPCQAETPKQLVGGPVLVVSSFISRPSGLVVGGPSLLYCPFGAGPTFR